MNSKIRAIGKETAAVLCVSVFFMVLLIVSTRIWRLDMNIPFFYGFEEAQEGYGIVKGICEGSIDVIPIEYSPLYVWELQLIYAITGGVGIALNISLFINMYITLLITYAVCRRLKSSIIASIVAAVCLAMSSYPVVQEFYYNGMSQIMFVPLSIWLCVWIFEADNQLSIKIIPPMIFIGLISITGGGYYLFFTCVIMVVAGVSALLKTRKFKSLFASGILVAEAIILEIILNIGHTYIRGDIEQSEVLGLKLFQFFVPTNSIKVNMIQYYIEDYNDKSMYINENIGSYLGIVGIIGFIILIVMVLASFSNTAADNRLVMYSELVVALIFVGEMGGLGTLMVLVTGMRLVAFNRVSIFIMGICVFAVAYVVDLLIAKINRKWLTAIVAVVLIGITAVSAMSQFPQMFYYYTELSAQESGIATPTVQEVGGVQ